MIQILFGEKQNQSQRFLQNNTRIPVTEITVPVNAVVMVKTKEKDGYSAVQLGIGSKKKANKAIAGHVKKSSLEHVPTVFGEVRLDTSEELKPGDVIAVSDVFKPGDVVDIIGTSKGKGYAGVVKRHHFKGGPRTHGQSDRERAPGSIGQTTTPGRVYKGKRMAGRMGHARVTLKNLQVVGIEADTLLIKGLVPGPKTSMVMIKKVGEAKKFVPLLVTKEEKQEEQEKGEQDAK